MIDREHGLPVSKQANILNISRGSVCYTPRPVPGRDLRLMRRIDELHMDYPFAGSRMMQGFLNQEGFGVVRKHTATLMRKMGIEALYRRPRTTRPGPGHKVYPYLLKGMTVDRPNQVWATDISYIPMARGSVYLCAVIDWFTRRVLSWRLSISMETAFCVEALQEALEEYGAPAVFNTDQGSQFTAEAFTGVLRSHGIQIPMDGKAAWRDNVFVERLWRTVKYEEVCLRAYASVAEARESLARYFNFHNTRRPHQALDGMTPDLAYFNQRQLRAVA